MAYEGRLPARRLGQIWYVERNVLEEFAATYERRPRKPPQRRTSNTDSREKVARLLAEWQSATADELAVGISLHPGNVRKHLVILAAAGVAERDHEGLWRLTAAGRRLQEEIAKAS
jgi:DNA-binding transcriptional ArsR family regulator